MHVNHADQCPEPPAVEAYRLSYNPLRAHHPVCTAVEWRTVRPAVLAFARSLPSPTPARAQVVLGHTLSLVVWVHRNGGRLDADMVFASRTIEAYVAQRNGAKATVRSLLRSVAEANGVPQEPTVASYAKPALQQPYAAHEEDALWRFARNVSNETLSISLRALLVLGFGCGISRSDLRPVSADSVHEHHGDDQPIWHVATNGRCVPVAAPYAAELQAVCQARPTGRLIGRIDGENLTAHLTKRVNDYLIEPRLTPDRLRATWMCRHLQSNVALLDLLAWSGLHTCEAIDGYLPYVTAHASSCVAAAESQDL